MRPLAIGLVLGVMVSGCGSKKEGGGGGSGGPGGATATPEVTGTVLVDGKPVTITRCVVERRLDTRVTMLFAGGSVSFEDDHLFLYEGDDDDAIMRGTELSCGRPGGNQAMGTGTDRKGWVRGTLRADCTGPRPVKVDVTLACGAVSAEDQKQIEALEAQMKQPFVGGSAGSAGSAGTAGSAGSAGSAGNATP